MRHLPHRELIGAAAWTALAGVAALGCGSDTSTPGSSSSSSHPQPACAPGELGEPGACTAAGLRADAPCAPGELSVEGACVPAGVPAEACGPGFVGDGAGCTVVGAPRCRSGMLALPGEAACHAVAPCPAGKWPEAGADAVLVHVDGAYAGPAPSDGSEAAPFPTIQEGIDAAPPGAVVRIAEGSYAEDLELYDAVTLAGGCPERVEVSGSSSGLAAVWVRSADDVVLRDLAITGASHAVLLDGSEVLLERVWIHDAPGLGRAAPLGPPPHGSRVTVRGALLEGPGGANVLAIGSELIIDASLVRHGKPGFSGLGGVGVYAQIEPRTLLRAAASISASIVEDVRDLGVTAASSDLTMQDTLVRGTRAGVMGLGRALNVNVEGATMERSSVTAERCVFEDGEESGVVVESSDAVLRAVTIRGVAPSDYYARPGRERPAAGLPDITMESSLVEGAPECGIVLTATDARLRGVRVRDPGASDDPQWGQGIQVESDIDNGAFGEVSLDGVVVERVRGVGIGVYAASASIAGTLVREVAAPPTAPVSRSAWGPEDRRGSAVVDHLLVEAADVGLIAHAADVTIEHALLRGLSRGLNAQRASTLLARSTRVEGAAEMGVYAGVSELTLEGCAIVGTTANAEGRFGDGLVVVGDGASATISRTLVDGSARAALLNAGARVAFGDSAFLCSGFDLEGEAFEGTAFRFDHLGGTVCGCGEEVAECQVLSAGLEPAPALPEPEP
ncbi:MAG: hypothetical protein WKG00_24430 [Polyangiaceae bacterium]